MNIKSKSQLALLLAGTVFTVAAFAQAPAPAPAQAPQAAPAQDGAETEQAAKRFKAADTNGDGKLSKDEAKALPGVYKNFDQIDSDKKGYLTFEQVLASSKKAEKMPQ
jgi:hypothetical protein